MALTLLVLCAGLFALGSSPAQTDDPMNYVSSSASTSTPLMVLITTPSQPLTPGHVTGAPQTPPAPTDDPMKNVSCVFSVKLIDFGLQIELINSTGLVDVDISEPNKAKNHRNETFIGPTYNNTGLKPCTAYEVTLKRTGGVDCTNRDNSTSVTITTDSMRKGDVTFEPITTGILSIKTGWDFPCKDVYANQRPAKSCGEKQCCVKATASDLCTNFTVTFNQSNCTFKDTTYLDAEKFVNLVNLTPTVPYFNNAIKNGHPPQIDLPLPDRCNLTVNYTCGESNITLSDVEPFEVYNCTGNIKEEDKIITRTNPVCVNTSCGLDVSINMSSTNNSIGLEWNTETENCNITQLRPKLKYECSCSEVNPTRRWPSGPYYHTATMIQKCDVTGLKAFTEYECNVYTIYNNKPVPTKKQNLRRRTEAGVPDGVKQLTVNITENNVFIVTCKEPKDFRGGLKTYEATLYLEDKPVEKKPAQNKCHFEFRDLDYLTTYRVEVRAFNGKLRSEPSFKTVGTLFNDKALIGVLVLLILIITVLVVLYTLYFRRRHRSQSDFNAIYANASFRRNR